MEVRRASLPGESSPRQFVRYRLPVVAAFSCSRTSRSNFADSFAYAGYGRAALRGTGPNDAMLIAVTDHRKTARAGQQQEDASDTPARINMDLIAAEIHVGQEAKPMKLR